MKRKRDGPQAGPPFGSRTRSSSSRCPIRRVCSREAYLRTFPGISWSHSGLLEFFGACALCSRNGSPPGYSIRLSLYKLLGLILSQASRPSIRLVRRVRRPMRRPAPIRQTSAEHLTRWLRHVAPQRRLARRRLSSSDEYRPVRSRYRAHVRAQSLCTTRFELSRHGRDENGV